jgi:hypothetical protein
LFPHGDIKELVMELLFMGLDTLRAEDKTVCFLHPNDSSQQAKKQQDIPAKFQKMYTFMVPFGPPVSP